MRTFVAIEIPTTLRQQLAELIDALQRVGRNVRWARPEAIHITLKFIGEVAPERVKDIQACLDLVRLPAPFPIAIRGAGYFPNARAPRVLWLGVEGGPPLAELAQHVEQSLRQFGIPKEDRPYSAHLTLGRFRAPNKNAALEEVLRQREPLDFGSFLASEFFLYESKLLLQGSEYRKIARFPIAEAPG